MAILGILYLLPFMIVSFNAFKTRKMIIQNPLSLPREWNVENFLQAMEKMRFAESMMNSLIITTVSVALIVFFSAMTAYVLVRRPSRLKQFIFYALVASMLIPFQALMIPLVKVYGSLGLLNSRLSLIYMYIGFGAPLAVFIYHGMIKAIPLELEEAAMIDGARRWQIFFRIVWPLLRPTTLSIVILDVLWIWNDFLLPSLVLPDSARTLPLATYNFFGTYTVNYGPLMAGLVLTMLPVLLIYIFLQRYIISGVMQGSIK